MLKRATSHTSIHSGRRQQILIAVLGLISLFFLASGADSSAKNEYLKPQNTGYAVVGYSQCPLWQSDEQDVDEDAVEDEEDPEC